MKLASDDILSEINVTPLVDVMLVLMIIFLVMAPVLTYSLNINLPNEQTQQLTKNDIVNIAINAKGDFFWNEDKISKQQLAKNLKSYAAENNQKSAAFFYLRADRNTPYEKISHVMVLAQKNGIVNIGLVSK
jgi:biopolymer transport protein ExbD